MLTISGLGVLALIVYWLDQNLQHSSFFTGYLLMGSVLFLAAFNLRKKLTFLPAIGSASMWMQFHIYVGWSTFVVFGFHVGWAVPNGIFESALAFLYLFVALSGVYGLYITRVLPKRLAGLNEEVIYERIPGFRIKLARQVRELVLKACESTDILAKLYANELAAFFERPRGLAYMVSPNGRRRRTLISEINNLDRYLAPDQRKVSHKLKALVQKKDDLDYHAAVQGRLKLWLFLHVGMTYSLVLVGLLHGVMAMAFGGGMR